MAQQPNSISQLTLGPTVQGASLDIIQYRNTNNALMGWVDSNGASQGVSFVVNALQNGAAVGITGSAGGVFSTASKQVTLLAPGNSALEQVPFVVKASGVITLSAGTYTATIQPLLYASTTSNFTAAAANAIYSAAAVGATITATAAFSTPWEVECHLIGDSTSGLVLGWSQGVVPAVSTGTAFSTTPVAITAISNGPTSVTFSAAVPLAFAAGVTLGGTAGATSVVKLGSFILES
jgi:hypothetical protein